MTPAIEFRDVSFAYGHRRVLERISFSISPHETVCFVGPNGGGKSTALKLMLGLLSPQEGQVRALGKAPQRVQRRIGYMPQSLQFDPLFPLTVRNVVLAGRLNGMRPGYYSRKDKSIAAGCLEELELGEVADHPMAELSGGQRQRVLIARALAVEPEILLLDEPTAMVDAHLETRLLEKIRSLHRRLTIVLVSHDAAFVSSLVERVFCVNTTVTEHAAEGLTAETMNALYGDAVQIVRHDHDCAHDHGESGHE